MSVWSWYKSQIIGHLKILVSITIWLEFLIHIHQIRQKNYIHAHYVRHPEVILWRLQPWILNIFGYCMWYKLSCFWKHFFGNRYLSVNVCSLIILWCWLCFLHSDSLNALLACATKMIDRRVSFRTNNKHQQLTQNIVLTTW